MAPNNSIVFKSASFRKLRLNNLARPILPKPTATWSPAAAAAAAAAGREKSHKVLLTLSSFLKRTLSSIPKTCRNLSSITCTEPIDPPSAPINLSHPGVSPHFRPQKIHPLNSSRSSNPESDTSACSQLSYPNLRNRSSFPCTTRHCTETFPNSSLLEKHKSVKNDVSVLTGIDDGTVAKIFEDDEWTSTLKKPKIHRVLEINHSADMLMRFENYLRSVKNRARTGGDVLCAATGNEQRRFYGSTFKCDLGLNGNSSVCRQEYCGVCRIIKSGFGTSDGISMLRRSSRAHLEIPKKLLKEEKRAVLICRVVAGRDHLDSFAQGGDECDSTGSVNPREAEELLVYKPEAVLPTHVVVYTV